MSRVELNEKNASDEIGKLIHDNTVGQEILFNIEGGVVEVLNNKVILLAE